MSTQRLMQFNPITLNLPLLLQGGISINIPAQGCPLVRQRRSCSQREVLGEGSSALLFLFVQSRNPGSWKGESLFVC